ncbi:tetratricopeptide repeat protein, partial [Patescibacteria group bacterium]|nr:tetratricopeptide repeat protein [Patescibacteria group bacterium]
ELWNLKGVVLKKLGRYDQAVGAYQNATEMNPDGFEGWNNLGVVQALAGNLANLHRVREELIPLQRQRRKEARGCGGVTGIVHSNTWRAYKNE